MTEILLTEIFNDFNLNEKMLHIHVEEVILFMQIYRCYRKVPKFSDARNLCCNLPKIQTKRPNLKVFC